MEKMTKFHLTDNPLENLFRAMKMSEKMKGVAKRQKVIDLVPSKDCPEVFEREVVKDSSGFSGKSCNVLTGGTDEKHAQEM